MDIPLLESMLDAHGGIGRWMQFSDFITDVEVQGTMCAQAGRGRIAPSSRLLLSLRGQRAITLLPNGIRPLFFHRGEVSQLGFDPLSAQNLTLIGLDDLLDESLLQPNELTTGHFMGNVVRYSLMAPFLYASAGVLAEETEPWEEDGELCRVLKVTLPAEGGVPVHIQYAYVGEDGLIRRTRNRDAFLGDDREVVNYVNAYMTVNGIRVPRSRSVFSCDPSGRKVELAPLARITFSNAFFTD
jgi:hypothetical protein